MPGVARPPVGHVSIIGLGLIGGSLAAALTSRRAATRVVGVDTDEAVVAEARKRGRVDAATPDLVRGVAGADIVVAAVPPDAIPGVVRQAAAMAPGAAVTDVGSAKRAVVKAVGTLRCFVPGHPIAGTERSGIGAADRALFAERIAVLTPTAATDPAALDAVRGLWEAVGARVITMDADRHDRIFAAVSHLPHALAYALVNVVGECMDEEKDLTEFAAGGFKDYTRITLSDPALWASICVANGDHVAALLTRVAEKARALAAAVTAHDAATLVAEFARAKRVREAVP